MSHTIYDIARQAGVSIATVSRVFNKSTKVSPKTRDKVLQIADQVGYHPQGFAQGLAARQKKVIMAVVPLLSNYFFLQVLSGIQDAISETDFELHIYNVKPKEERIGQLKRLLGRKWADGYLFVSTHLSNEEWEEIHRLGQHMVLIDDAYSASNYFQIDNKQGACKATEFFLEKGLRRLALITAEKNSIPAAKRQEGFLETLNGYGVDTDSVPIVTGNTTYRDGFNESNGYEAMNKLLALDPFPEAVVCASDIQAIGALSAMKEQDVEIPIIGYDDIQLSRYIGLSTMRQPMSKMGYEGTKVLFHHIDDEKADLVQEAYIPELIHRSTTENIQ
ncbi:LacI family transcriptional regulator [Aliifodinibius salicampi]|uniref:LacI family transcriptional regulator n=1 Tax=Fodinibius salicampi TaxID=1920655 RepID=A0ABT3PVX9_9BACT|nr:LacI family DNA-binding transcriptional regulator [Fodinibius salicampi]MCW9712019.1 LacI family transcriptional regulator [Fodinibius salicampi]